MKSLVLLIALIPSISHAQCEVDGVNAIYKEVPRLQGVVAQAYKHNGKYIIEYGKELKYMPPKLREHVLAHECAHHRLKHTAMPIAYENDIFEFEADCDALVQLNWKDKEIDDLINIWTSLYPKNYIEKRSESLKKCIYQN